MTLVNEGIKTLSKDDKNMLATAIAKYFRFLKIYGINFKNVLKLELLDFIVTASTEVLIPTPPCSYILVWSLII